MTIIKDFSHFSETEALLHELGMKHAHTAKTNLKQMQHKIPRGAFGTLWKYDGPYGEGVVIFFKGTHGYEVSYYLFKTERRPPAWKR